MPNPQHDRDAVTTPPDEQRDVPPDNQPGHHPAEEQDKPPLDRFAAKLGTMPPEEREDVLADEREPEPAPAPGRRNVLVGVAAVAALLAVLAAVVTGRRRRSTK